MYWKKDQYKNKNYEKCPCVERISLMDLFHTIQNNNKWSGPCLHPEHNPPNMMVIYQPYEHVCPGCGRKIWVSPNVTFM